MSLHLIFGVPATIFLLVLVLLVMRRTQEFYNEAERREIAEQSLRQAQKMEAVGQLTGGVAHDFNNLLMAILGSLELVRKRLPYDPKITPLIDNAMHGAQRGATLTQRLLSFARKQELKTQAVDLAGLVRGMTGLFQRSIGPSVAIETHFPSGLPRAVTDPNQLETALLNLVVNARDAMPEGGTIRIGAAPHSMAEDSDAGLAPGGYVRLWVTDDGQGMDAQTLARAADPFYTTKGVGKGTGLGLSMAQGLAEQSGGRLVLRSQPGKGATVEFWLPEARSGDEHWEIAGEGPAEEPLERLDPLLVLAVDDDALVLMNTIAMLEDLGHRVFSADSARDALAILRREKVDVMITDYAMPQTNGVQLAEAAQAQSPHTRVILATGYAELPPGAETSLLRLSKPFVQNDLARALRQVLSEDIPA